MILQIDTEEMQRLGLKGNEVLVYAALKELCKDGKWMVNYTELARLSLCGTPETCRNTILRLIDIGVISFNPEKLRIIRKIYGKEKRSKKEKDLDYNKINYNLNINNTGKPEIFLVKDLKDNTMLQQVGNVESLQKIAVKKEEKGKIPSETGYYKIIIGEFGYLNPGPIVHDFRIYYSGHGWPAGNKLNLMKMWMQRLGGGKNGKKPVLTIEERTYLQGVMKIIDQQFLCGFFDNVQRFNLYPDKAVFYIKEENLAKYKAWFAQYVRKLKEAYNCDVYFVKGGSGRMD